jgi:hypothetical protein
VVVQALPVSLPDPAMVSDTAHPSCPQLQEISVVFPESLQYWLQYFVSRSTVQLQAGCAHFFMSLAI